MPLTSLPLRLSFVAAVFGGGLAWADPEPAATAEATRDAPPRNYGNLRIGASTSARRPSICLELSPLERVGVEACGTGSGFLHHDPEPEIAHFRANFTLTSWKTQHAWLQPRLSAGFAELQVGEDGTGFHFSGVGATGIDTAGPEVGASLRALLPVSSNFELVGEVGLSAAYFRYAPELNLPQSSLQPSATLTLGFGF